MTPVVGADAGVDEDMCRDIDCTLIGLCICSISVR